MQSGPTDELILAHTNRSLNVYGVGHYFAAIPHLGITLLRYRICINHLAGSPGIQAFHRLEFEGHWAAFKYRVFVDTNLDAVKSTP